MRKKIKPEKGESDNKKKGVKREKRKNMAREEQRERTESTHPQTVTPTKLKE